MEQSEISLRDSHDAMNKTQRAFKRLFDIIGSALALLLLWPVMLVFAILLWLQGNGPAIFRQERIGKGGRPFTIYKFRTMSKDCEKDGPQLVACVEGMASTGLERFLRLHHLDELPQLWNVLKAEMSIVGPRPPIPREVAQYTDWDWGRLAVKPGLTCYWQVSGRSDVGFEDWMRLDLKYVEEQGFLTDMKILFKTVGVVLRGDGAY